MIAESNMSIHPVLYPKKNSTNCVLAGPEALREVVVCSCKLEDSEGHPEIPPFKRAKWRGPDLTQSGADSESWNLKLMVFGKQA